MLATLLERHSFALHGVCAAEPADHPDAFRAWLDAGRHGEMQYLAEHADLRLDVRAFLPDARSVIVVADSYGGTDPGDAPPRPGRVARYAWGRDYHKTLKRRLHRVSDALRDAHPEHTFRATVDTAPIMEREHASRAGLGFTGKHTLLIHPRHGSFLLLGAIVTTLALEPTPRPRLSRPQCGHCTRCIGACPTDAIDPAGHALDATRCISYLTLEHRSAIDPDLHAGMGDWIAGCDICQDVCPFNAAGQRHPLPVLLDHRPRGHAPALDLRDVLGWDENDRFNAVSGTPLMRIKLWMWKRNALIAAGNAGLPGDLREAAEACLDDPHPVVRETARVVLDRA